MLPSNVEDARFSTLRVDSPVARDDDAATALPWAVDLLAGLLDVLPQTIEQIVRA